MDVGCGSVPKGDVNTDLYIGHSPHHKIIINPKRITNFVLSDAHYIPFRSQVFNIVNCSHVLEHLDDTKRVLSELARVSSEIVFITVPNNPIISEHKEHLYSWSIQSLNNLLSRDFTNVKVYGRTKVGDVNKSRIFKICALFPAIGKPLLRFLCRIFALEIHAICRDAR